MSIALPSQRKLGDINVEIIEHGSGVPLVFLHAGEGLSFCEPLFAHLANACRVIAASHPGFGHTDLPASYRAIDDLAYFYLDLFDALQLRDAILVGTSFGGWIAAEIAIRSTAHLARLVLADAVGIRVSQDETAVEIEDIFTLHPDDVERRSFADPAKWRRTPDALSDDELGVMARNRESHALFGWMPYMYNPLLKRWLRRIRIPTLVLWGERDGIASTDYGRAYAGAIPGARFEIIPDAAHHVPIEQPERFAAAVLRFASLAPA
ncbi:MAG: alpha/beta hydrolase [Betaproteobacteria bacterium]|nr:alpha/beta hydrolase [Betaproteobacteria bacterium]